MTIPESVHGLLDPLIGEMMANSTMKVNSSKLGKTPETLAAADMPAFAEGLAKGLILFIGSEKANEVRDRIAKLA